MILESEARRQKSHLKKFLFSRKCTGKGKHGKRLIADNGSPVILSGEELRKGKKT